MLFVSVPSAVGAVSSASARLPHSLDRADSDRASDVEIPVRLALINALAKSYGGARIEILPVLQWYKGIFRPGLKSLSLLNDDGRGNIQFSIINTDDSRAEGWAEFRAWIATPIAVRRLRTGDTLRDENFSVQEVNAAVGQAHEYRGVIFRAGQSLDRLEAMQTILEGQFLTTSAIHQIPDVRRGDSLRIRLVAGDLELSTTGISEESGYINQPIRARASHTKKELAGILRPDGQLEVKL